MLAFTHTVCLQESPSYKFCPVLIKLECRLLYISVSDQDPNWILIQSGQWIRIRTSKIWYFLPTKAQITFSSKETAYPGGIINVSFAC
jgi:hypothetical protein